MATVSKNTQIPGTFTLKSKSAVAYVENYDSVWGSGSDSLKNHISQGQWVAIVVGSKTRYAEVYIVDDEYFTALPKYDGSSDATGAKLWKE